MQMDKVYETENRRFYGRRQGHSLSLVRKKLMSDLLPDLLIDPDNYDILGTSLLFKPNTEVWMEIGFGAGEHLVFHAERNPKIGFIGCEPYVNGMAALLSQIKKKSLTNIRLYNDDARILIKRLAPNFINRVFILFSDPWPKKRHHRRRYINVENLNDLSRVMRDRAKLHFATDDMGFARWSLDLFNKHPDFSWLVNGPEDWRNSYPDSTRTRYEKKAINCGRKCIYLTFQRHMRY